MVGVLRGAFMFMADLVRAIPRELTCDFLGVRSYGDATVSSGVVEITSDLAAPIAGRRVLLVEDIVDTGLTLRYLVDLLQARGPGRRPRLRAAGQAASAPASIPLDFVGFEAPDAFVVGYGLDAGQHVPKPSVHRRARRRQELGKGLDSGLGTHGPGRSATEPSGRAEPSRRRCSQLFSIGTRCLMPL